VRTLQTVKLQGDNRATFFLFCFSRQRLRQRLLLLLLRWLLPRARCFVQSCVVERKVLFPYGLPGTDIEDDEGTALAALALGSGRLPGRALQPGLQLFVPQPAARCQLLCRQQLALLAGAGVEDVEERLGAEAAQQPGRKPRRLLQVCRPPPPVMPPRGPATFELAYLSRLRCALFVLQTEVRAASCALPHSRCNVLTAFAAQGEKASAAKAGEAKKGGDMQFGMGFQ
jgi:hypothetical protein